MNSSTRAKLKLSYKHIKGHDRRQMRKYIQVYAIDMLEQCKHLGQIHNDILHHFQTGMGGEIHVTNGFEKVKQIAQKLKHSEDLGGNSAQMALRAFKEGATVYLQSKMSKKYYTTLFNSSIIVMPSSFLNDIEDVHIVVNYHQGDIYNDIQSPQTNRLYLQNDQDNVQFPGLKELEQHVNLIKPDVLVLGGFQLMNQLSPQGIDNIIGQLSSQLKNITQNYKVHFEMGAFDDKLLMDQLLEHIIQKSQSIGLNEQELQLLHRFIDFHDIREDNNLSQTQYILMVQNVLQKLKNIERIHFHSQKIQMICSNNKWGPIIPALHRSIVVGLIQAMKHQNDNLIDTDYDYTIDLEISLDENLTINERLIKFQDIINNGSYCWQQSDKQCCVAATITHPNPKRTCGLGDNIGATSLLYQLNQYN
ncbi:hypothetical protein pb186bvf_020449 [Paramecium bursaria]